MQVLELFWQILAFYFLFIKMIKHISANYRRRRLPDGHRGIGCDFDLLADETTAFGRRPLYGHD